jgi:hypothetical protein
VTDVASLLVQVPRLVGVVPGRDQRLSPVSTRRCRP